MNQLMPGSLIRVAHDDISRDLYELSQHPSFPALYKLFQFHAMDYYQDMPMKEEHKAAYETSCYVANTMRELIRKMDSEIQIGEQLTHPEDFEGESNGGENRHHERVRA